MSRKSLLDPATKTAAHTRATATWVLDFTAGRTLKAPPQGWKQFICAGLGEWNTRFELYRLSRGWQMRQTRELARAGGRCRRCSSPAKRVHHVTYLNAGAEKQGELLALCDPCQFAPVQAKPVVTYADLPRSRRTQSKALRAQLAQEALAPAMRSTTVRRRPGGVKPVEVPNSVVVAYGLSDVETLPQGWELPLHRTRAVKAVTAARKEKRHVTVARRSKAELRAIEDAQRSLAKAGRRFCGRPPLGSAV